MMHSHQICRSCLWLPCNDCKPWLIAKEQYLSKVKELFNDTVVKITSRGRLTFVPLSTLKSSSRNLQLRKFRNGWKNSLSCPTLPPPKLMPHSLLFDLGMCATLVKILAKTFTRSCKNFARILERLIQDLWQECLIIMQDPCKILQKSCKILARIIKNPCKSFFKILAKFSKNYPRFLPTLSMILARFFQNPCNI